MDPCSPGPDPSEWGLDPAPLPSQAWGYLRTISEGIWVWAGADGVGEMWENGGGRGKNNSPTCSRDKKRKV